PPCRPPGIPERSRLLPPPCARQCRNPPRRLTLRGRQTYVSAAFFHGFHARGGCMPHHKSAEKRVVTNELRRQRNVAATTRVRTATKAVRSAATRPAGEAALKSTGATLDRTAAKGIIKRETASRQKSRLAKFVHKLPA